MEVDQILHMNGGNGETSYAKNSTIQRIIASLTKRLRQMEAVESFLASSPVACLSIADLGCSSGPNVLLVAIEIIEAVEQVCSQTGRPPPDFQILLNDLPSNDFNTVFSSLNGFHCRRSNCFVSGVPGSFYGRLFPSRSLHFIHSSSSLHWLSQVPAGLSDESNSPVNMGKIHISESSPAKVLEAYYFQFEKDFGLFLKCRGEEMVEGGRMVLTFMGRRRGQDPRAIQTCYYWDLLAQSLMEMANEGLLEKEKVDRFDAPYYAPSPEEVSKVVKQQRCFSIIYLETFEASWSDNGDEKEDEDEDEKRSPVHANRMAKCVRAVVESMLVSHFGEQIIEQVFQRYERLMEDYYSKNKPHLTNLVLSLVRKPH